jgi:hypothetical protein
MVAAVAIANIAFFMSEAFPVPGLQSAGLALVSRERRLRKGCREI